MPYHDSIKHLRSARWALIVAAFAVGCGVAHRVSRTAHEAVLLAKVDEEYREREAQASRPVVVPLRYEDAFKEMVTVLGVGATGKTDLLRAKLDSGAQANKSFLIQQLDSRDEDTFSTACYELRFVHDDAAAKALFAIATSSKDASNRMSVISALGCEHYKPALPMIKSIVQGPYKAETWSALGAYYRIDPKGAIPAFKKRLAQPDGCAPHRAAVPIEFMAAIILDSDPVGESNTVLAIVARLRSRYGAHNEDLDDLEQAARSHRGKTKLLRSALIA